MEKIVIINSEEKLFEEISLLIEESRKKVAKAVNTAMVYTYYKIGCYIVEYEQQGNNRASYGKKVLANLSVHLTGIYGKGWSVTTLNNCRKFYSAYRISCATHTKSAKEEIVCSAYEIPKFTLSWNHYQILMRRLGAV